MIHSEYKHKISITRQNKYIILLVFLCVLSFSIVTAKAGWCENTYETFFTGTDYELKVYKIRGKIPGKTILIIGGIQGDEPGGFLSADLYADMKLARGNLIVVPRANFYSIVLNRRQINEDMNRKFSEPSKKNYEAQVVHILKKLMGESDCLLNLHDGSGFYSDTWQNKMKNPMRFGQSIITDCETYTNPKTNEILELGKMGRQVVKEINKYITNPYNVFHLNNHRTKDKSTQHPEQRKSATYYALYKCGIPAFGIESSKSLSVKTRIYHHNLAVNAFMNIFDIKPEVPGINICHPTIKYVVMKINNQMPIVVADNETLTISPGDVVRITHIEGNYERGLSADIRGYGSINDLNKALAISKPTQVIIRKDHNRCGKIHIALNNDNRSIHTTTKSFHIIYFKIMINGEEKYFPNGAHVNVIKGDQMKLVDVGTNRESSPEVVVNFKGFVGNRKVNTGEDRGYIINTDRDLWKRYSLYGKGRMYQVIVTENDNNVIGRLFVDIKKPLFRYLVLQINDGEMRCFPRDETISIDQNDKIKIIDIKTNVTNNFNVNSLLIGHLTKIPLKTGSYIEVKKLTGSDGVYKIIIKRGNIQLGMIHLLVSNEKLTAS